MDYGVTDGVRGHAGKRPVSVRFRFNTVGRQSLIHRMALCG
jgi:hypothetical protein